MVGEHRGPHLSVSRGVKNTRPPGYLYHSYSSGPTTVRFGESSIAHLGYSRLHNNHICFCSVPVCQKSVHNSHTLYTVMCLSAKNLVITATSASESCVLPRVCSQESHLLQNECPSAFFTTSLALGWPYVVDRKLHFKIHLLPITPSHNLFQIPTTSLFERDRCSPKANLY